MDIADPDPVVGRLILRKAEAWSKSPRARRAVGIPTWFSRFIRVWARVPASIDQSGAAAIEISAALSGAILTVNRPLLPVSLGRRRGVHVPFLATSAPPNRADSLSTEEAVRRSNRPDVYRLGNRTMTLASPSEMPTLMITM